MDNTGVEPEAVEVYGELGDSHALAAKFTIKICRQSLPAP